MKGERFEALGLLTARAVIGEGYSLEWQRSPACELVLPLRRWHVISFYPHATRVARSGAPASGALAHGTGHVGVYPAGVGERIRWVEATTAIHLHLSPARCHDDRGPFTPRRSEGPGSRRLRTVLGAIYEEACARSSAREPRCRALVGTLVQYLAADARRAPSRALMVTPNLPLEDLLDRMHGHAAATQSVSALAAYAGLSRYAFTRRFDRLLGTTPKRYLLRSQVELVKHALFAGEGNGASIAAASGFADQSHMIHSFTRLTGLRPSEYQRHFQR